MMLFRLYVATTGAKDDLHLIVPQRFFTHGQNPRGAWINMSTSNESNDASTAEVEAAQVTDDGWGVAAI